MYKWDKKCIRNVIVCGTTQKFVTAAVAHTETERNSNNNNNKIGIMIVKIVAENSSEPKESSIYHVTEYVLSMRLQPYTQQ